MRYAESENVITLSDYDFSTAAHLKVTGTRLGALCGINPWSTPFQAWCELTKAAKPPFEDSIYMRAGRTIEPKVIQWLKSQFGENRVLSPKEYFGRDMSNIYDFYPDEPIFGGMWDALLVDHSGRPAMVFEIKTSKRVADWLPNPPLYYLAQGMLYTKLLGIDKVCMVLCCMDDIDYEHPEDKIVNSDNTVLFHYNINEKETLDIDACMRKAKQLWVTNVQTGISPQYDEKKDAEYLKILRTNIVKVDNDMTVLIEQLNQLTLHINHIRETNELDELEKQQKALKDELKSRLISQMAPSEKYVECDMWKVTKREASTSYDVKKAIDDNPQIAELLKPYKKESKPTFSISCSNKKE